MIETHRQYSHRYRATLLDVLVQTNLIFSRALRGSVYSLHYDITVAPTAGILRKTWIQC